MEMKMQRRTRGKNDNASERRRQDNWLYDSIGKSNAALRLSPFGRMSSARLTVKLLPPLHNPLQLALWFSLSLCLIARASKEMATNVRSTKNWLQILIRSLNNKQPEVKNQKGREEKETERERDSREGVLGRCGNRANWIVFDRGVGRCRGRDQDDKTKQSVTQPTNGNRQRQKCLPGQQAKSLL